MFYDTMTLCLSGLSRGQGAISVTYPSPCPPNHAQIGTKPSSYIPVHGDFRTCPCGTGMRVWRTKFPTAPAPAAQPAELGDTHGLSEQPPKACLPTPAHSEPSRSVRFPGPLRVLWRPQVGREGGGRARSAFFVLFAKHCFFKLT